MSFYNFIKGIFGFPDKNNQFQGTDDTPHGPRGNEFRNPIWNLDEDDDDDDDFRVNPPRSFFGVRIFHDPIEIRRLFEEQMSSMFRMFDSPMFGADIFPALPDPNPCPQKKSLRDQYLKKPEHDWAPGYSKDRKMDSDLDDRNKQLDEPVTQSRFFNNFSYSTIINGRVEEHHTVTDSQGNEEKTVTKKLGDQSYSVTVRTDPSGKKIQTESFVNLDKDGLEEFKKKWNGTYPSSNIPLK
ncbi:uncharacterized protein [Periplaneta americana]|uniref:uncharacterized protein isoform X2 n=1 Tax=Periplaneta americana TaxID=6978 RepID=UPI0037E9B9A7